MISKAAVGVAGPVVDGRSHVVNLRWSIDARRVAQRLGVDDVLLLNDLEATAWGIPSLPSRKLVNLTPGLRSGQGNAAVIAAGTGLGMAITSRVIDLHDGKLDVESVPGKGSSFTIMLPVHNPVRI